MKDLPVLVPGPRAHLAGTRRILSAFATLAGGRIDPDLDWLLGDDLPAEVPPEDRSLKYDAYLSPGPREVAWGVAVAERWEAEAFRARSTAWLKARVPADALAAAGALGASLASAAPSRTVAAGYDRPGAPPRVKLYFPEDRWQKGVATVGALRPLLAQHAPACLLPPWVPDDRAVGVLSVEVAADGALGVRVYLGAPTAGETVPRGAPDHVHRLAATLDASARTAAGTARWAYLTLRLRPDAPVRTSANHIYDHVAGFRSGAAWGDVERLFAAAGRRPELAALQAALGAIPGLRVVPTAAALDDTGASDVYCAAWAE